MKKRLVIASLIFFSMLLAPILNSASEGGSFRLAQALPPPGTCEIPDPVARAQALATFYRVPYPARNSPALDDLITCIRSVIDPSMIDESQIYTYQRDPDLINYTRGNRVCGLDAACGADCHEVYSCHYGGRTGLSGAEGVDFNAQAGTTEEQLFQAIRAAVNPGGACYWKAKFIDLEGDHTHLSTSSNAGCDTPNISPPGAPEPGQPTRTPHEPTPTTSVQLENPLIDVENPEQLVIRIVQIFLGFLALIGLSMFIYGGFVMLTSAGNVERIKKAKATLVWSSIGIAVILGSYTILRFVFDLFVG